MCEISEQVPSGDHLKKYEECIEAEIAAETKRRNEQRIDAFLHSKAIKERELAEFKMSLIKVGLFIAFLIVLKFLI